MSQKQYQPYDFRQAGAADDSANAFRTWIAKASQSFIDLWAKIAGPDIGLTSTDGRTLTLESAMKDVPATSVCCTFNISDEQNQSIWYVSQEDAHRLVAELLDMAPTAELPDRPLTELEFVLAETFFDTLAQSITQGWLGQQSIHCNIDSISLNPKRVRLCRGKDFVTTSLLQLPFERGEVTVHWVSKKQEMSNLLEQVIDRRTPLGEKNDPREVVERLPMEIVGLLGKASIPMGRLANIAVGDIVRLNQKIDKPIIASVAGRPFFECWPGKIGETVGLEISSCLRSTDAAN